ncbi:MAG: LmeA family phospholipid-binding protein [Salinibacterium amurskyense]
MASDDQPTIELRLDGAGEPAATTATGYETAKRKRRSWIGWVIAGAVLVILIVGVVLVETVGRTAAVRIAQNEIASSLGLESSDGVAVDLGSGSLIVQALTGGLDVVTIDIDRFEVNGLESSVRVVASGVPVVTSQPIDTVSMDVAITGDEVSKLATILSGTGLDSIALEGTAIRVSTVFELLFFEIPVALDLVPVAAGDSIAFEPESVILGEEQISVADLLDNPLVSGLAGGLLSSQEFCVASSLPTALTIDSVAVANDNLVIQLSADGIALGDDAWNEYGTCPAP